jgi:hypothetical protein
LLHQFLCVNRESLKEITRKNPRLRIQKTYNQQQCEEEGDQINNPLTSSQSISLLCERAVGDDILLRLLKKQKQESQKKEEESSHVVRIQNYMEFNFESRSFTAFSSPKSQEELNFSAAKSYIFRKDDYISCVNRTPSLLSSHLKLSNAHSKG